MFRVEEAPEQVRFDNLDPHKVEEFLSSMGQYPDPWRPFTVQERAAFEKWAGGSPSGQAQRLGSLPEGFTISPSESTPSHIIIGGEEYIPYNLGDPRYGFAYRFVPGEGNVIRPTEQLLSVEEDLFPQMPGLALAVGNSEISCFQNDARFVAQCEQAGIVDRVIEAHLARFQNPTDAIRALTRSALVNILLPKLKQDLEAFGGDSRGVKDLYKGWLEDAQKKAATPSSPVRKLS